MAEKTYEVLSNARFYLEIHVDGSDDRIDGYFMECQGFKRTQEVVEICEVTSQNWGKKGKSKGRVVRTKVPGNVKSENIILRRGLTVSQALWDWFKAVEQGKWSEQCRDGDIAIYTQGAEEAARFRFQGAWPTNYKLSDFKAGSGEFEIEELELAVDEFIRVK
jgi:phage tail-like protein